MGSVSCPHCSATLDGYKTGRLPPWCPRCGMDLKPGGQVPAAAPAPVMPANPTAIAAVPLSGAPIPTAPVVPAVPVQPLPYFRVRATRELDASQAFYRVYLTEADLFFMRLGCPVTNLAPPGAVAAGALFGLVGMMVVSALTSSEKPRDEMAERGRLLDMADEEALRRYLKEGDGSFAVARKDVRQVWLEPVSFWKRSIFSSSSQPHLKLTHAEAGDLVWELPSFQDLQLAREKLRESLGDVFTDKLRTSPKG